MPGTTPSKFEGYHPPSFPIYEAVFTDLDNSTTRWLHSWNGLVSSAAVDVTVAARAEGASALVTSSAGSSQDDRRIAAILAAVHLGDGLEFVSAEHAHKLSKLTTWTQGSLVVDGEHVDGCVSKLGDTHLGYSTETNALSAAWHGEATFRRVRSRDEIYYIVSPLGPISYDDLNKVTLPRLH